MLSVEEAARLLGVHPGRVRQLVAAGELDAQKIGGRWLVPTAAVTARAAGLPPPGRPLSPRAAWGLLATLAGQPAPWLAPSERRRARTRADRWPLDHVASACRRRAAERRLFAHSSVLAGLVEDHRVLRSGASARSVPIGLIASDVAEVYVDPADVDAIVAGYSLHRGHRWNVVLRVAPADLVVRGDEGEAAWPVVAVDLHDAGDDRSRRAAAELVESFGLRPRQ